MGAGRGVGWDEDEVSALRSRTAACLAAALCAVCPCALRACTVCVCFFHE